MLVRFLVAVPVGAVLGGVLLRRGDRAWCAVPGLALASAGLAVMATWGAGSLSAAGRRPSCWSLVGLGIGLAIAPVNAAALADAPPSPTASPGRWSSWPGWSAWSWGWRC